MDPGRYMHVVAQNEALEKRLAQMHQTQTLSAQTILALRKDLSDAHRKSATEDVADHHVRIQFLEQMNRQLEVKVAALEQDLGAAHREAARARESRTSDALTLADTFKSRLALLAAQIVSEPPQLENTAIQQTLAQLVADNTLLRHDNAQLSLVLADLRHGNRHHARTASRTSQRHSISDTPSRPDARRTTSDIYPRPLTLSISSTASASHSRHHSLTPSLGSGNPPPPYTYHTRTDSYTPSLASPRSSVQGEDGLTRRPTGRRTCSIDRPSLLNRGGAGVSSIAESSLGEEDTSADTSASPHTHARDVSHSSTSSNAANTSTSSNANPSTSSTRRVKRLSLTPSFRPPVSPLSNDGYFPPLSTGTLTSSPVTAAPPPAQRRPLKLLSCSVGVQTDPTDIHSTPTAGNKATLAGLGFEEASVGTAPSSTHSTPLFLSPYSPYPPTPNPESSSFPHQDGRTASLLVVVEHMSKILLRVRQADVPTLTRRLKKQHLPGDVGHLSSSTLKSLTDQVADMRTHFRRVLDDEKRQHQHPPDGPSTNPNESLVTRKDFMLLIKLFKEMFTELVQLRTIVNQIILDPFAVTRLKESVQAAIDMADPADQAAAKAKQAKQGAPAGLGWIAAPISKLFTAGTASAESSTSATAPPTLRSAPKLEASTSASTTHVNVEFASTGIIRRSTHALPVISSTSTEADPYTSLASISPPDTHGRAPLSRKSGGGGTIKAKPRPAITLGDGSTRGGPGGVPNARAGLMGIFAGAPVPSSRPTIRPKASLEFHGTQRRLASHHRRQVSNAVDAVIDQPLPENANEDEIPTLLERQLRPRGLSDSSIRTTFQSHAVAAPVNPHPRAPPSVAGSYWPDSRSMVKTLGKRIQAFTGASESAAAPAESQPDDNTPHGKHDLGGASLSSTPAIPVGIRSTSQAGSNNLLGGSSYKAMGTSYMDILTSTSLITDNAPHLTHSHHVADFER